jgi:cell division protein FtsQ
VTSPTRTRARRPPIDPRIRERRQEVTRSQGRRRLRILLVLLGVVLLVAAAAGATRSPLLDVDRVLITGAQHTSVPDVLRASGFDRPRAMIDVQADESARRLRRLAWVGNAHVERKWPSTIHITLDERVAVASVPANGGGWAAADAHGRVLARQAAPLPGLPQIAGGIPAGEPGTLTARPVIEALAVAAALPADLRPKTPIIGVTPEGVELRLLPAGVAKLGSTDQLDAKLDAVLTVLQRANVTNLAVLDVRVPGVPVLTRR